MNVDKFSQLCVYHVSVKKKTTTTQDLFLSIIQIFGHKITDFLK